MPARRLVRLRAQEERQMIHPATEVRETRNFVGVGVFATDYIPKGTIVWILDRFDRIVTADAIRAGRR